MSSARNVLLVAVALSGPLCAGQNQAAESNAPGAALEIASIKLADFGTRQSVKVSPNGTLMMTASPTVDLIKGAYPAIPYDNVIGLPDCAKGGAKSERYNITAKPPASVTHATADQQIAMLRALLLNRYKLAAHTEARVTPLFNLVRARRDGRLGPNLRRSEEDCIWPSPLPHERPCRPSSFFEGEMPIALLLEVIRGFVGRPVIDKTGLVGSYHVKLTFDLGRTGTDADVFTAIQEQLGLKFEAATSPVDFLVIDHIERPTAN